ncbi:MAG: putative metal-binding motif-containing protein, partial [Myxococcota bacterium]
CIEAAGSTGRRVCTDFCSPEGDTCPEDFTCAAVSNSGADLVFLCFPQTEILCLACESDSDCGGLSDMCLELLDGSFCGRSCELQACPEGYTCTEVQGADGELVAQCQPDEGLCSSCFDPDGDLYGIGPDCLGLDCNEESRDIHDNALELCNRIDDDCDNRIDEAFDFASDPNTCGDCDTQCSFEGAEPLCEEGRCVRGDCLEDRYDID